MSWGLRNEDVCVTNSQAGSKGIIRRGIALDVDQHTFSVGAARSKRFCELLFMSVCQFHFGCNYIRLFLARVERAMRHHASLSELIINIIIMESASVI